MYVYSCKWETTLIRTKFFNISLIFAHAPTEENNDELIDSLFAKAYERCTDHYVKIVLGDFNPKVGREDIFDSKVGKFSLHIILH